MNVPPGTPLVDPTLGDCMRPECDGNGGIVLVPYSLDVPNDGNQCTMDACNGGTPTYTSSPQGTVCSQNGGQQCDGLGACKKVLGQACGGTAECLSGFCADGVCCNAACGGDCVTCNASGTCVNVASGQQDTCAPGSVCNGVGTCKLINGQVCGGGAECMSTFCVDGRCCNSSCNTPCHACNVAGNEGSCVVSSVGTQDLCAANQVCSAAGTCKLVSGQACGNDGTLCASGLCVDGVCCDTTCGQACHACNVPGTEGVCAPDAALVGTQDACSSNEVCNAAGSCKLNNGELCGNDGTLCVSGNCTDGVCCGTACTQACHACDVPGSEGVCAPDPAANGLPDTCNLNEVCDATGSCKLMEGEPCVDGTLCASGNCTDGVCCNASCGQACYACDLTGSEGTCLPDPGQTGLQDSCPAGQGCNATGQCVVGATNGTSCATNPECASNRCVDDFCCNTNCNQPCHACNVSGSEGTCAPDPTMIGVDDGCPGAQTCNAAGICQ
jgi:hypothetical protein